ncbi:MAG: Ig-like domain-containing protein [Flavobacteriales bacterium]
MARIGTRFSGITVLYLLSMSCAQMGVPSGGEVDHTPPEIISISPALGATDVSVEAGGTIEVLFDEYVNVRGLGSQLLVSPPLSKPIEWRMRGKAVTFTWLEPLIDNVTYVFQFGDAVIDLHEGNPTDDFIHAFSTGADLDTLSLSGAVVDAFSGSAMTKVRIFLFDSEATVDSIEKGLKPQFMGTTDEQGLFTIRYLPVGNYRVMAVDDQDRNYQWTTGESLAICEDIIGVTGDDTLKSNMRMQVTPMSVVKYFVHSERDSLGLVQIEMSQKFTPSDTIDVGGQMSHSEGVNMWAWGDQIENESVVWPGIDTLVVSEIKMEDAVRFEATQGPGGKIATTNKVKIQFTRPIEGTVDRLFVVTDMDSSEVQIDSIWTKENDPFSIEIAGQFNRGNSFEIMLMPGSVQGQGAQELQDTSSFKWSIFQSNELGEIEVIILKEGWLQLLSANGEVTKEIELIEGYPAIFKDLTPGTYSLKWKGDSNKNGSWESVSLSNWKSPEPAQLLNTQVKVKADWRHQIQWLDEEVRGQ